jgi:cytochrome c oxidase assembly protein Cox11
VPFNWFCNISGKCQPIDLSFSLPMSEGKEKINVAMEISNYHEGLEFTVLTPQISTVTGRKNTVNYRAKNISKHKIKFRPTLIIEPENFDKYIKRSDCLCAREYRLDPGEEITLRMSFVLDKKLLEDEVYRGKEGMVVRIRYAVKN